MDIPWFIWLILAVDFVISLWNAYAAGFSLQLTSEDWGIGGTVAKFLSTTALLMGFAGTAYVLCFVFGFAAFSVGYIGEDLLVVLMAYDFLIFGGLITFLGIIITVESVVTAYKTRNKWQILRACYNVFATVWNLYTYVSAFNTAKSAIKGGGSGKNKVYILVAVAVIIAFLITYAAYQLGAKAGRSVARQARIQPST